MQSLQSSTEVSPSTVQDGSLKEKYYIEPMQRKQGNWMEGKTFLPTFGTLLKVGPGKDRHKHLRGQEGGAGPKIPVGLAGRKEVIGP